MTGDFQKNSLGLVWLAGLLYSLHLWMVAPSPRRAVGVLVFWGMAVLTHIGVFGASLLFGGLCLGLCRARQHFPWRTFLPLILGAVAVSLLAGGVVFWKFDAARVGKLASALGHPADYLTGNGMGSMPPRAPGFGGIDDGFLYFGMAALAGLYAAWRQRRGDLLQQWNIPVACALGVLVLTGPWIQGDKAERFRLLAIVPAILAATCAVVHCARPWLRNGVAAVLGLAMAGSGWSVLARGSHAVITEEGFRELQAAAPLIAHPEKTLIAARHGMEWWTAWALHTHIAQSSALRPPDWQKFEAVYFLKSQRRDHHGPPPGGMRGPRFGLLRLAGGPPRPGPGPGGPGRLPPGLGVEGMRGNAPGGQHQPWAPGGQNRNFMEDPEIPSGAELVHQGENFTLARVTAVPDFVCEQAEK